ncbi:MAG: sigma-70 family RNA polymerase sigma factor [Bacteroidota bacterium]|nr:sigma-70 family RNA polymerase sigma factor [Bacteroidota bacterium]
MNLSNDNIYIEKVLNGDRSAFSFLINNYKDMVYTIVLKIVRSREDAEEIAQDVFLKAFQSLSTFRKESRFSTWIYRIAYNMAIFKTRQKRVVVEAIDENIIENYSVDNIHENVFALDADEKRKLIDVVLDNLPEDECLLITLYYKEECTVNDVAEILNLTQSNVKVKLHRTRKKLSQKLNVLIKEKMINLKSC